MGVFNRLRPINWLLGARIASSPAVRAQLEAGLFASLPIFFGGAINTIVVAAIAAMRQHGSPFKIWLGLEIALAAVRFAVVLAGRRALDAGKPPPAAIASVLSCAWAASVGFGTFITLLSGDWVLATVVCISTAGMVCGICLRNFGTPRLAATMVTLALGPCALAGAMASEQLLRLIAIQLPLFVLTITAAASYLHRIMVSRMTALSDLRESELFIRTIMESSPDYTLILDAEYRMVFCNYPVGRTPTELEPLTDWFSLLPPEDRENGRRAVEAAHAGQRGNLVTSHTDEDGSRRWFHVIVTGIADETRRLLVVARDITHQKLSEDQALWMARHDVLTGLPNRAVLHDGLDAALMVDADGPTHGLLIVDVDNFKTINDTLGHDAGDALLCEFANRLRTSAGPEQLVVRTGGDEFALLLPAKSEEDLCETVEHISERLKRPFHYGRRLVHCGASIGASLLPVHGTSRLEIMKAADIALYAAKAAGKGTLRIFKEQMKEELEHRQAMVNAARNALARGLVEPHYQPKICLRTSRIIGFEALLRWTDEDGELRGPDDITAAFDDPDLAMALSARMFERTLDDLSGWLAAGVDIGHVAINVTTTEFRDSHFARNLLTRLKARNIAVAQLQLEVTETVFLGPGTDHIEAALFTLSEQGIRIALDDFGTGYASLAHLSRFPIDLLKIDRSFVQQLGGSADADAICAAVINLGHCLGMETVAEGVETAAQQAQLARLGCDTAQGFFYAAAIQAEGVPDALKMCNEAGRALRAGGGWKDAGNPPGLS